MFIICFTVCRCIHLWCFKLLNKRKVLAEGLSMPVITVCTNAEIYFRWWIVAFWHETLIFEYHSISDLGAKRLDDPHSFIFLPTSTHPCPSYPLLLPVWSPCNRGSRFSLGPRCQGTALPASSSSQPWPPIIQGVNVFISSSAAREVTALSCPLLYRCQLRSHKP